MFCRDLERYRHGVPAELPDVVTVGWLSRISDYRQGDVQPETVHAIEELLSSHRVNQMRGHHVCEFCLRSPVIVVTGSGRPVMLGSAEIWVPSPDRKLIYAAPDLLYHYIVEHKYLPPDDFLDAVMAAGNSRDWDADRECQTRLEAAFRD
jgi:hypothetical protein